MFAKLFDTKDHGQILVTRGVSDDSGFPELVFSVEDEKTGVLLRIGLGQHNDSPQCYDRVYKAFTEVNEEKAIAMVLRIRGLSSPDAQNVIADIFSNKKAGPSDG